MFLPNSIPLQAIHDSVTAAYGVNLFMLRTDLIHEHISGNKWFKLHFNLLQAKSENKNTLLTFGGAFSNHIAATAAAGKEYQFKTIGIIRGEEHTPLNPTLALAKENGMELLYVSRTMYRDKQALMSFVEEKFAATNYYLVPEGGSNSLGVKGCKEIINFIPIGFDCICCACGTGATVAGVILSLTEKQRALGFQVLKAEGYINEEVNNWIKKDGASGPFNFEVNEDYHFGGYAKHTDELKEFVQWFNNINHIPLDYVYTGKMMFGIYDLMKQGLFKSGETIVAIHTGGLQGNQGVD